MASLSTDPRFSRTYRTWSQMKQRCSNPRHKNFKHYGARGIGFDQRWHKFFVFFADMGPRPEGRTLDRINNDLGYSKENCRWATQSEQLQNTRRSVLVTYDGQTLCVTEWARRLGLDYEIVRSRIRRGWTPERALTRPVGKSPRDDYGRYT